MEFEIRESTPADMPQVWKLINELAEFEKEAGAVEVTVDDLVADGFGDEQRFHCFVAESNDRIVGMALVYWRYSTWKGPAIHLEDLIVTQSMRGAGVGSALFEEVIRYSHRLGVRRINWEVINWNEPAIKFYESKGAKILRDWNVVHMNEQGIRDFIAKT